MSSKTTENQCQWLNKRTVSHFLKVEQHALCILFRTPFGFNWQSYFSEFNVLKSNFMPSYVPISRNSCSTVASSEMRTSCKKIPLWENFTLNNFNTTKLYWHCTFSLKMKNCFQLTVVHCKPPYTVTRVHTLLLVNLYHTLNSFISYARPNFSVFEHWVFGSKSKIYSSFN